MFRISSLALVAALGLASLVCVQPARAQEDGPPPAASQQGGGEHAHRKHPGKEGGKCEDCGPGERMERIHKALFKGIELSDDQKAELKKIHEANQEKREAYRKDHKDEIKAFGDAMKTWHEKNEAALKAAKEKMKAAHEAKDRDAMKAAMEEMKALMESRPKMPADMKAAMEANIEATEASIRKILTPDQVKIFDKNAAELKERMEKGMMGGPMGSPKGEGKKGDGKGPKCDHCGKGPKGAKGDKGDKPAAPPAGEDNN